MMKQRLNPDGIDMIKELRLRRWARENYVPAFERKSSWDPIVLEEMFLRDQELEIEGDFQLGNMFVPLEPSPYRAIHAAHETPGIPNVQFADDRDAARDDGASEIALAKMKFVTEIHRG